MQSTAATYWDKIARDWKNHVPHPLWRKLSDGICQKLLAETVTFLPGQRILKTDVFDEAVADGVFALLEKRFEKIVGCDISWNALSMAKERFPHVDYVKADVCHIPFADKSFDWVLSLSTLDHFASLQEIENALREINRVLKPHGGLILTLDNLANPFVYVRNFLPTHLLIKTGIVPYSVGCTFRPGQLCHLMARSGFEVDRCQSIFHSPRVLAIPLINWIGNHGSPSLQQKALNWLKKMEVMDQWPTRFITGHLIAATAHKN